MDTLTTYSTVLVLIDLCPVLSTQNVEELSIHRSDIL